MHAIGEIPIVAGVQYAGSLCIINDDIENEFGLYLKATEDDSTVSFYFWGDRVTFQGTLHNIGPEDMARGIEGLTDQIRKSIISISYAVYISIHDYFSTNTGVKEPEYNLDHSLHDSPNLYFELESISIQFTPELSRAYDLVQKIKGANIPEEISIDLTDLTASDALRGQVAMSLVRGDFVDGLHENKQLRCDLKSLCYMKSLYQNTILEHDGEILCEINLNEGMMYSDFLRENGDHITNESPENKFWIIHLIDEDLSFGMNSLDKFTVTIGPNCHFGASHAYRVVVHESGMICFKVGYGGEVVVKGHSSPQRLREVMNEEDFEQKLSNATLPGVSAGFPECFKITVTQIFIQNKIVKRFLDIGE